MNLEPSGSLYSTSARASRLTVDRLHELRARHLEQALRDIIARHDTPKGDGATVLIARRALGELAS